MPSADATLGARGGDGATDEETDAYYGDYPGYSGSNDGEALDDYWSYWDTVDEFPEGGGAGRPVRRQRHAGQGGNRRPGESVRNLDEDAPPFGIPEEIWNALDGGAKAQYLAAQEEAERNRRVLHNLGGMAPSVDDLSVEYLDAGASQLEGLDASDDQLASMAALRGLYEQGGYTAEDEQARRASAMARGQMQRGSNEAALQQAYARGMGGGGGELAARLSGSQAMIQGQAQTDAAIQQAAMQRSYQAMQGAGQMSNTVQAQELARRGALDSYNQQNVGWKNRSRESRAGAYQQNYGNAQARAALHLGHNPNTADSAGARSAQTNQGLLDKGLNALGTVGSGIVGG